MTTPDSNPAESTSFVDTEHGVTAHAGGIYAALLAEDANPTRHIRHSIPAPPRDGSSFAPQRSLCGIDGLVDNTNGATSSESIGSITCETCKAKLAERHAAEDLRSLQSLAKAPKRAHLLIGPRRWRLENAGFAVAKSGWLAITDAGKAHLAALKPAKKAAPKLSAGQQKRVRELMEDEGQTRAEATAWVLAFEPTESKGAA